MSPWWWLLPIPLAALIGLIVHHSHQLERLRRRIEATAETLREVLTQHFLVQPCSRCHEFAMRLLELSPNARSVHYQCVHCKKKLRAAAGTPDAPRALELWDQLAQLVEEHNQFARSEPVKLAVKFDTPAAPLPYEQTTRTPIPEAVRNEVWRRDGGCCVQCGSKANLQYDHIIPVSRGGATTAKNLQLLCEPCNRAKADKV